MIFGMSAAAELYQLKIEQALPGIPCVKNISDNVIIGGRDTEDLLQRMEIVFERLREKNLTLNKKKCKFLKDELIYMGNKLSAQRISPDNSKVEAVQAIKVPTNLTELQSFLGIVTYCAKFIPNFATITDPLRQLLKKDVS